MKALKVVEQYIVGYHLILKLEDGTYRIGHGNNYYAFENIDTSTALNLLEVEKSCNNNLNKT